MGETQKRSKAPILLPQTAILSVQLPNLASNKNGAASLAYRNTPPPVANRI
jgi:hypothetical protein